jgi:leader peptidase (prepilin peptidase) / N-methyltransferase
MIDGLFWGIMIAALAGALFCLTCLMITDLRHYLLPDKYVFTWGVTGVLFHTVTHFALLSPGLMVAGSILGGGLLWVVRYLGTRYYGQEAMGLGDVKLLLAAGLWLGPEHTTTAILVGAAAGLVHGLVVAAAISIQTKTPFSIRRLVIPAGPGFIVGIVAVFLWAFGPATLDLISRGPW